MLRALNCFEATFLLTFTVLALTGKNFIRLFCRLSPMSSGNWADIKSMIFDAFDSRAKAPHSACAFEPPVFCPPVPNAME
jgi:hypothetical protein